MITFFMGMVFGVICLCLALIPLGKRAKLKAESNVAEVISKTKLLMRSEYLKGALSTWEAFYNKRRDGVGFSFSIMEISDRIADDRQKLTEDYQRYSDKSGVTVDADIEAIEKALSVK